MNGRRRLPFVTSLMVILASTGVLYLLVGDSGVRLSPDSFSYLEAGINFSRGHGLFLGAYKPAIDSVGFRPLSHFPPLVSLVYGSLICLGINPSDGPTLVSLVAWMLFLSGTGWLTYRLSGSPVMASVAVTLAAMSYPYLVAFEFVWSEVIFLPLLLFSVIVLVDLPQRESGTGFWLVTATILLALLMLTRFVGMFIYAAVLVWWCWWRVEQRRVRELVSELALLSCATLPLLAWFIRTTLLVGRPFTGHMTPYYPSEFADALIAVARESAWVILPTLPPCQVWELLAWGGLPSYLIPVSMAAYLLRGSGPRSGRILAPPRSPVVMILVMYLALFTLAKPLYAFTPMNARYATVALCLVQPWLLSLMARVPARRVYSFLSGYLALNLVLVFAAAAGLHNPKSMLQWLSVTPPRLHDLADSHSQLVAFLQPFDSKVALVTNAPLLFAPYQRGAVARLTTWLAEGACICRDQVVIVIVNWDTWAEEAGELMHQVEQKCPGLTKITLDHGVVYQLPRRLAIE